MGNKTLTTFVFHRNSAQLMAKTRVKAAINANYSRKCRINHIIRITHRKGLYIMAKRNVVTITLPHGVTVKADKLADRTIRTVKEGDYVEANLTVRGTECTFYACATRIDGEYVSTVFGSEDRAHMVYVPKGEKVNVYRPL